MKKCVSMFIGMFLLSGTLAHAGGENSLQVLFQIGDTIVSPGNLSQVRVAISKMLEQQTSCMNDRGVTVDSMMASLLSVCQQRRNLISQELPTWHSLAYKVVQKVKSILESSASIDEELEACLITVEDMKSILAQNDNPIKVALNPSVNLDACIRGIAIDEKAIDPFESVYSDSPIYAQGTELRTGQPVSSLDIDAMERRRQTHFKNMTPIARSSWIQNLTGGFLNDEYIGPTNNRKTYRIYSGFFNARPDEPTKTIVTGADNGIVTEYLMQSDADGAANYLQNKLETIYPIDKALIFNGHSLIACENGVPRQLGRPVFSGYAECHSKKDEALPGVGNIPDGVYILDPKDKETYEPGTNNFKKWGALRIRLTPTYETDTYGRENFYLHGNDNDRPQSAGCISMGTLIDEFVNAPGDFMDGNRIMLIVKKDTANQWFNVTQAYERAAEKGFERGSLMKE